MEDGHGRGVYVRLYTEILVLSDYYLQKCVDLFTATESFLVKIYIFFNFMQL